ncbi:MAG TPA: DUF4013 domain-containing protein [Desulfomonilaceae bacterium]|nr:DUF4013 domain-containing protein [Desulfomonilaceae bacterium]
MEKKEARIKCSGCGSSYKLRIPVTEKPVSFKCKKCGKVLKIRITASAPAPPQEIPPPPPPVQETAPTFDDIPQFETTQLPDTDYFARQDSVSESDFHEQLQGLESHEFSQSAEQAPSPATEDLVRRWIVLSGDMVKGPFSDEEIVSMIRDRDVTADTSLRMGERPWIKASEIAVFRQYFSRTSQTAESPLSSMRLTDTKETKVTSAGEKVKPFFTGLGGLLPYPLSNWKSLAIFLGIAFLLSSLLSFDFLIGLPVNLIGWIILYGYLAGLMHDSGRAGGEAAPPWDFSKIKNMAADGTRILAVLLVYSLIPVTMCLVLMIASVLNGMPEFGYVFLALAVVLYAASLVVVPAALVILDTSQTLGAALNPGKVLKIIRNGGRFYLTLSAISLAAGLVIMLMTVAAVFLVDVAAPGFLIAGLGLALVLSYGHFVWFHVIGRFSGENEKFTGRILAKTAA